MTRCGEISTALKLLVMRDLHIKSACRSGAVFMSFERHDGNAARLKQQNPLPGAFRALHNRKHLHSSLTESSRLRK